MVDSSRSQNIRCSRSKLFLVLFTSVVSWQLDFTNAVEVNYISLYETSKSSSVSIKDGSIHANPYTQFKVVLFGSALNSSLISFSKKSKAKGKSCSNDRETEVQSLHSVGGNIAVVTLNFKKPSGGVFYICVREAGNSSTGNIWRYQGTSKFLFIQVLKEGFTLPLWLQIILIAVLMILSGLFSGLNLGLMSLDPNELKIVSNSGTDRQKSYAKKILPVRCHGNFLLCTLLLGNTLVNSSFTILLDEVAGDGMVAVVGSTFAIVIFGEIVPQSICSRYGLAVGAYTIYLTRLFMMLTSPLSWPVSKLLDCILGKELGNIYNKQQLLELVKLQSDYNDLEQNEVGIISGALKYGSKVAKEVMTPIDDCYLLDEEAILDFQTMSSIMKTGYSRIPIYSGERANVVAVLFVKDLAFVDPDDCIPLLSVIKFNNRPVHKVHFDTTLDAMFEHFKKGQTHISIVITVVDDGERDPYYECIGIVTLEDVLEEIIQAEIVDETDVYRDNVKREKVLRKHNEDFSLFLPAPKDCQPKISPQLAFAIYQYLSTAVGEFNSDVVSRSVLKKIIEHRDVIQEMDVGIENQTVHLYKKCMHCDFFTLILQGRVEVAVGCENITFEDGPFSVFGINALICESGQQFVPDYSVKVLTKIQYLKVSRSLYRSAVRASKMEKENKTPDIYQEYDEIFWTHMKNMGENHESHNIEIGSNKSDRSSLKSAGSTEGTPNKFSRKRKSSLLNKLTPKFDRKKNSPTPTEASGGSASVKRKPRNELSISSLENPLMTSENEETGDLLVDSTATTSDPHA